MASSNGTWEANERPATSLDHFDREKDIKPILNFNWLFR